MIINIEFNFGMISNVNFGMIGNDNFGMIGNVNFGMTGDTNFDFYFGVFGPSTFTST